MDPFDLVWDLTFRDRPDQPYPFDYATNAVYVYGETFPIFGGQPSTNETEQMGMMIIKHDPFIFAWTHLTPFPPLCFSVYDDYRQNMAVNERSKTFNSSGVRE